MFSVSTIILWSSRARSATPTLSSPSCRRRTQSLSGLSRRKSWRKSTRESWRRKCAAPPFSFSGTLAVSCSLKAASGFIYLLERGIMFVYKPPILSSLRMSSRSTLPGILHNEELVFCSVEMKLWKYVDHWQSFNWDLPKNHKFLLVSKFWHLELFWWDLLCNLTLRTFRGVPVKKNTSCIWVLCGCGGTNWS